MDIKKARNIPTAEVTVKRIVAALIRRVRDIPHSLEWQLHRKRGSQNIQKLKRYSDKHINNRCFVIGNGPSLAKMDLKPLKDEITFGLNRIYLLFDKIGFETTYHVTINGLVLEQYADEIAKINSTKFLNWRMRNFFREDHKTMFVREIYRPGFSTDISHSIWGGATVTYAAIQIAYYMGFRQVILIGVDHNFSTKGTPHEIIEGKDEDRNHFDKSYFSKGFKWQLPDLITSEFAFELAKKAFEEDGREIVDATLDGKLEVFPKVDYQSIIRPE